MAVVLHPSTPATATAGGGSGAALTTASFTPPDQSLLVAFIAADNATAGNTMQFTVADSGGLSWSQWGRRSIGTNTPAGTGQDGYVSVWTANCPTGSGGAARTVTATATGVTNAAKMLTVKVFTDSGGVLPTRGAIAGASAASGIPSCGITTTADLSWCWAVCSDWTQQGTGTFPSGQTRTDSYDPSGLYTGRVWKQDALTPTSGTAVTMNMTGPSGQMYNELALSLAGSTAPLPVALPLSRYSGSVWNKATVASSVTVDYPTATMAEGDVVYAIIVVKPDTATVATPSGWTLEGSQALGGGSQGAGTGPGKIWVFSQVLGPGGKPGTSQVFTITSGSSAAGVMHGFAYDATGYTSPSWQPLGTFAFRGITLANTDFSGTGTGNPGEATEDWVMAVLYVADDQAATHTISNITAIGATIANVTQNPSAAVVNTLGNDMSASTAYGQVVAGAATGATSVSATISSSETGGWIVFRIRALGTPAASTTPVSASRGTTWATLATAGAGRSASWETRSAISAVRSASWTTRSVVSAARSTTWAVAAPVLSVTAARATSWVTRAAIAAARPTSWATAAQVSSSRSTSWVTRALAAASRSTTWNVFGLTAVAASRATSWVTRAGIAASRASSWETRTAVLSNPRAASWKVLQGLQRSAATTWATRQAITATRSTTWATRVLTAASRATSWATRALAAASRSTTWNTNGTLLSVTASRSTTWRVDAIVQVAASRAASWVTRAVVLSNPRAASWVTRSSLQRSAATTWKVRQLVSANRATSWATLVGTAASRATSWSVLETLSASRATSWAVAAAQFGSGKIRAYLATRETRAGLAGLREIGIILGRNTSVGDITRQTEAGLQRDAEAGEE